MIKVNKFRGEKVKYPDGVGCCIWETIDNKPEDYGICFDFAYEDIDDIIKLLQKIKKAKPEKYKEN